MGVRLSENSPGKNAQKRDGKEGYGVDLSRLAAASSCSGEEFLIRSSAEFSASVFRAWSNSVVRVFCSSGVRD